MPAPRSEGWSSQPSRASSPPDTSYLKTTIRDGCFVDQVANPDFGACPEQQEMFCPDGRWVQVSTENTLDPRPSTRVSDMRCLRTQEPATTAAPTPAPTSAPAAVQHAPVTIEINTQAVLEPQTPQISTDAQGKGIRHAHTNFYTHAGVLESTPSQGSGNIRIRATPVTYLWDYGDGTIVATDTPCAPEPEFDVPTPTSHVYTMTGTYQVRLTTIYIAEVSYDAGTTWQIDPTPVRLVSDPIEADIWRFETRNVDEPCFPGSTAWGCQSPWVEAEPEFTGP